MRPGLPPGRIIIAWRWYRPALVGDVVVIRYDNHELIKRVHATEQGKLYLLGDDPGASTDSRSFGWLSAEMLVGIVVWPRQTRRRL